MSLTRRPVSSQARILRLPHETECQSNRGWHELGIGYWGQVHEEDCIIETTQQRVRNGDRYSCLPHAAWTDDTHEAETSLIAYDRR